FRDTARARDPQDRLQVAQSARTFLQVRLQIRCLITRVALLLLELFCFQKSAGIERRVEALCEISEQLAAACKMPRLEQRRLDGNVLLRHRQTLGDRAHTVSDFETDVPQRPNQLLELSLEPL